MPLKPGKSKAVVSKNIHEMVQSGHSPRQAVAASLHNADKYAMGGYAEGGEASDGDDDKLMDHVALELMHAIEMKDKAAFMDAFHVLVANIMQSMCEDEGEEE